MNNKRVNKRKFIPPAFSNINTKFELLSIEATLKLASELIQAHKLNKDQAAALIQIAQMMASRQSVEEAKELATHTLPITIIHGKKQKTVLIVNTLLYKLCHSICTFVIS